MNNPGEGLEDLGDKNLDFSQFHPMGHKIWSRDCTEHFGGRKIHYRYWKMLCWPEIRQKWFFCWWGSHQYQEWHRRTPDGSWHVFYSCRGCDRRKD